MLRVEAWRVHDTGLVAAPGRFRRLGGLVRHHRPEGAAWPVRVVLELDDGEVRVAEVGTWPRAEVRARKVADGPPVSFVLDVPGSSQLLAAPAGEATERFLAALSAPLDPPPS